MPATGKSAARPPRATKDARERYQLNGRAVDRVAKSLETAQADLTALRGTMGSGASDLRKDVARLIRDARRDVAKLSKALKKDLEQLQKDLSSATPRSSGRPRRAGSASPNSRSTARAKRTADSR